jgi:hypothetical protein
MPEIDVEIFREVAEMLRRQEQETATRRRRIEALIRRAENNEPLTPIGKWALADGTFQSPAQAREFERDLAGFEEGRKLLDVAARMPSVPEDDEPTDAELAAIVAEGRARLAKQAPPCPDCRGRSGVAVADVVSGLCRACQAERLRIEFGEACPSLAALRRVGVNVLPPRDALAMEFDPAIFEEVA